MRTFSVSDLVDMGPAVSAKVAMREIAAQNWDSVIEFASSGMPLSSSVDGMTVGEAFWISSPVSFREKMGVLCPDFLFDVGKRVNVLSLACRYGTVAEIKAVLEKLPKTQRKREMSISGWFDVLPLDAAVMSGDFSRIDLLLKSGVSDWKFSPFLLALAFSHSLNFFEEMISKKWEWWVRKRVTSETAHESSHIMANPDGKLDMVSLYGLAFKFGRLDVLESLKNKFGVRGLVMSEDFPMGVFIHSPLGYQLETPAGKGGEKVVEMLRSLVDLCGGFAGVGSAISEKNGLSELVEKMKTEAPESLMSEKPVLLPGTVPSDFSRESLAATCMLWWHVQYSKQPLKEVVSFLLENGAKPSRVHMPDDMDEIGRSALEGALLSLRAGVASQQKSAPSI